jgi:uncharacterized UBP type Zn finger protein
VIFWNLERARSGVAYRVPKLHYRKMLQVIHGLLFYGPRDANSIVSPQVASSLPQFNEAAMAQLEGMGFPTIRCQKALLATGNSDPEAAMEWLFGHMEDSGK